MVRAWSWVEETDTGREKYCRIATERGDQEGKSNLGWLADFQFRKTG